MRIAAVSSIAVGFLAVFGAGAAALTFPNFGRDDYRVAAAPRGIVAADFNRDGWTDIATAGAQGGIGVLLNNGRAGGFTRLADRTIGGGPFDLAAGDLNGDAIVDLAVANADANAVDILIGAGDGSFAGWSRIAIVGGNPRGIALADYDRDGALDIIVTEYATGAWRIVYGDGKGAISGQQRFGSIAHPQGVVAADLNRDGRVDVAIAGAGINLVAIFFSQPGGGLVQRNVTVGGAANVLTAGDFDNDGRLDLAAASSSNSAIYTLRGGATAFALTATIATGASPRGIVAADMNQDGRLDLITGNRTANSVTVHLGRAEQPGTFAAPLTFAVGSGGRAVAVADFDHDGAVDLASANDFGNSATVLTNSTIFVAPAYRFTLQQFGGVSGSFGGGATTVADLDRDGRPDIVAQFDGVAAWLGVGRRVQIDADRSHEPREIAIADLNRDGAPDLVTIDYAFASPNVRIYMNHGDGTFAIAQPLTSTLQIFGLGVADFNEDGRMDLAMQGYDPSTRQGKLRIALGRGDGTFDIDASRDTVVPAAQRTVVADLNGDGHRDVVGSASGDLRGVTVWYGKGDGTSSYVEVYDLPRPSMAVAVADLNEDGILDLIATGIDRSVQVRLGLPTGGFAAVAFYDVATDSSPFVDFIRVADVNLDGHVDVITGTLDIAYGRGDGTLSFNRWSTFASDGFMQPAVADFNLDGVPDILFSAAGAFAVMVGDRGGVNHPPTVNAPPDLTARFIDLLDDFDLSASGSDADVHELEYVWRDADGTLWGRGQYLVLAAVPRELLSPGPHTLTVTASDGRGGSASDSVVLTITQYDEIYIHPPYEPNGAWRFEADPTAADGRRLHHPDVGAPKRASALADPVNYFDVFFPADPSQAYKLWLRLKAGNNFWGNDSVFVQFEGAVDGSGQPMSPIGSTSAMAVNLEECSGCGIAGWGWEDDAWGAKDRTSNTVVRFPNGRGRIRIQTREDGVSLDQIVLSAKKYLATRPGAAKNDTLILPGTVPERH